MDDQSCSTVDSSRLNGWMFQQTGEQVVQTDGCFYQTGEQVIRTVGRFYQKGDQAIRTNVNFFQTAFKQLLKGIPFENGKLLKHVFA